MKRIALLLIAGMLVPLSASYAAADASRTALAEQLMVLMKVQQTMEKSFEAVKQVIPAQLQQMGVAPRDAAEKEKTMAAVMEIVAREMSWEKLKGELVPVYAEVLTEEELKGLIEFYSSPIGTKFVEKQPELMTRSMAITQGRMMTMMPMIKQKIEEMKAAQGAGK